MIPVFVGGCGRSGTTLLAAELGRTLGFVVPPETQFLIRGLNASRFASDSDRATVFLDAVRRDWRLGLWMMPTALNDAPDGGRAPSTIADVMEGLVRRYRPEVSRDTAPAWVDHTPWNVMYAATLLKEFPSSPMIHLVRDPRGVAASVLPLEWGPATARGAAEWWMARIAAGLLAEGAYPDRVIRVHYEDLVHEPAATLTRLGAWLGQHITLDLNPRERAVELSPYTARQHALVGKPIDSSRAAAWKHQLTASQVSIIEGEVADIMAMLGYDPVEEGPALRVKRTASEAIDQTRVAALNRIRASRRRRQVG